METRRIEGYKRPEEIQHIENYTWSYPEGPEEDETREPQPDEPEEYWIKDCLTISIEGEDFNVDNTKFKLKGAITIIKCGNYYEYGIENDNLREEFSNVIDCLKWVYEKEYTIRNGNKKRDKYNREFLKTELNKLITFYQKVFSALIEEV